MDTQSPAPYIDHSAAIKNPPLIVWLTLISTLVLTAFVWHMVNKEVEGTANASFQRQVDRTHENVKLRMLAYEQVLRGGAGIFNASDHVSRKEWQTYVASLKIEENFPGIQAIAYCQQVKPAGLPQHLKQIRAQGFPDYVIRPPGPRPEYNSIVYIEPFNTRNMRAFGFDMLTEPTRRAAMLQARDTGVTVNSGKVVLKQETSSDVQSGFVMYLPIYEKNAKLDTIAERSNALMAYVASPFRMNDLMRGILGDEARHSDVDLEIYDGTEMSEKTLMFDLDGIAHADNKQKKRLFNNIKQITLQGHTWTLAVTSNPTLEARVDHAKPRIIAMSGILISFLFFTVAWSLATQRERAQALALKMTESSRLNEERFDLAMRGANDGMWDWDIKNTTVYYSPRWKSMLGHDEDEIGNNPEEWSKRIHPDDMQHIMAGINAFFERETPSYRSEYRMLHKDGHYLWILARGIALRDEQDKPYRMVGIMTDISKQKQMDSMKSEFVSTVSHELRTPLTSIRGSLGLVAGGVTGNLSEQTKSMVDLAYKNTERLLALINDILDIDKIQSGKMDFNFKPQLLMPLVEQAIACNAGYADKYQVKFNLSASLPETMVNVDSDRLIQVMSNLLSNAAKFSHAGGTVDIAVSTENKSVRVAIIDHGVGIPAKFYDHIFQKFTQADSSDTRHKGGTGLGLSISKAIIELMHGEIGFKSEAGVGTTFYFILPQL